MTQREHEKLSRNMLIGFPILLLVLMIFLPEPQIVQDVKSGDKVLTCEFSDGWRVIPKDKIVGLNDENGYWSFTNGFARNCEVQ